MDWRPRITLTYAQSLDGRIATATGDSRWISGEETLRLAHELRNEHDGILVGIGTVLADDPQLTCRIPGGRNPHRVVLDSELRTPLDSHAASQAHEVTTTIFCRPDAPADRRASLEAAGVEVVTLAGGPRSEAAANGNGSQLGLNEVLRDLRAAGVRRLLVEGGSGILTNLFAARLVDRLVLVCAPLVIGTGTSAVGDLQVRRLATAWRGHTVSVRQAGEDIVWEVRFDDQL